jgi:hypothetical protein
MGAKRTCGKGGPGFRGRTESGERGACGSKMGEWPQRSSRIAICDFEGRNAQATLRGVGENSEDQNSISGSADDMVRISAPCSQVGRVAAGPICIGTNLRWRLGASSLSLADALRRRPRRHHRPHRGIAHDVAGLTIRSSMARSISAPGYFFFTAFRFAGAFFFAAGFAFAFGFVAFFAILPS